MILIPCYFSDLCPAGKYRSSDKNTCEVCEDSTVSAETEATSCTACELGKEANDDKTLCGQCIALKYREACDLPLPFDQLYAQYRIKLQLKPQNFYFVSNAFLGAHQFMKRYKYSRNTACASFPVL